MVLLKVEVGIPVRNPLKGSRARPGGKADKAEKVTGPSALAVMNRAAYSALVVPFGSDWVRNLNTPLSAVLAPTVRESATIIVESQRVFFIFDARHRAGCIYLLAVLLPPMFRKQQKEIAEGKRGT